MQVRCDQCGAYIELEEDVLFAHCEYCTSTFYVEDLQSGRHLFAKPQIQSRNLKKMIKTKLNEYGYEKSFEIQDVILHYVPFWVWRQAQQQIMTPAYTTHIQEFFDLKLPGLDYKFFDEKQIENAELIDARLSPGESTLINTNIPQLADKEIPDPKLYHIPFYRIEYSAESSNYIIWIEAGTGKFIQFSAPQIEPQKKILREFYWIVTMCLIYFVVGIFTHMFVKFTFFAIITFCFYKFWLPRLEKRFE